MNTLQNIAKELVAEGKGILAADESPGTCGKRFDKYDIPKTPEKRREWRELLLTTPRIQEALSGVILHEETLGQSAGDGISFVKILQGRGIIPGIKVDKGVEPIFPGSKEEVTKGFDRLPDRLRESADLGARFSKWRAKILIDESFGLPTEEDCIRKNAALLAEYSKASQDKGLVPIAEPEVLIDGIHSLARSEQVLKQTLRIVFEEMNKSGVDLTGLLLKTSMAIPGKESGEKVNAEQIANATLRAILASVPLEVPGVVFLSGGQTPNEATERLNAIVAMARARELPWQFSFSFSRALQDEAMEKWRGDPENIVSAQAIFLERTLKVAEARRGEYKG